MSRVFFPINPFGCLRLLALALSSTLGCQPVQAQTFTILHSFSGGTDGSQPFGSLVSDKSGNLYGTTNHGGTDNANCNMNGIGCGTIFELTKSPSGWSYNVIYRFGGFPIDGSNPVTGALTLDKTTGVLYGTTMLGGTAWCQESQGCGTVFKLSPSPTGWTGTLVYSFTSADAGLFWPRSGLVLKHGNLYGTAFNGGLFAGGVFRVTLAGTESALYTFPQAGAYGEDPYGGLVADKSLSLYGTTPYGGACCGTVFKVAVDGTETVLHNFSGGTDGNTPWAGLVSDSLGNLYGTTWEGGGTGCGGLGCGTVFQLAPDGTETIVHSFNSSEGASPHGGVILDANGNLYGTTTSGGAHNSGTVFKLTPSGGSWTYRVLHQFNEFDATDAAGPLGSLLLHGGFLYGTTQFGGAYDQGTVFRLNPRR